MSAEAVLIDILNEIGIDRSNPQINATDFEMRQIVDFMNETGDEIAERAEWSKMYNDWVVPGGQTAVNLPTDWRRIASTGSARLTGTYAPIRVIIDPETWGFLQARPSVRQYCHVSSGQLQFAPILPLQGATVKYQVKAWVTDNKEAITENGDNVLIPESLITKGTVWRWKRQKGLPYDDYVAEYEAALITLLKADRGEA